MRQCPECGAKNPVESRFCHNCGHQFYSTDFIHQSLDDTLDKDVVNKDSVSEGVNELGIPKVIKEKKNFFNYLIEGIVSGTKFLFTLVLSFIFFDFDDLY